MKNILKSGFSAFLFVITLTACTSNTTVNNALDSLDSVGHNEIDTLSSTVKVKIDTIDSAVEATIDSLKK